MGLTNKKLYAAYNTTVMEIGGKCLSNCRNRTYIQLRSKQYLMSFLRVYRLSLPLPLLYCVVDSVFIQHEARRLHDMPKDSTSKIIYILFERYLTSSIRFNNKKQSYSEILNVALYGMRANNINIKCQNKQNPIEWKLSASTTRDSFGFVAN